MPGGPPRLCRAMRPARRRAGRRAARRAGRRLLAGDAALLRPDALPGDPLRPARLRAVEPQRQRREQHHLGPRRRHRAHPRRRCGSTAGRCSAARGAPASRSSTPRPTPTGCEALVLRGVFTMTRASSTGSTAAAPAASGRTVGGLRRHDPRGRARRPHRRLPPAAVRRRPGRADPLRPRLGGLGDARSPCSTPARRAAIRRPAYSLAFARLENHYFIHGGFLDGDGHVHAADGPDRRHPRAYRPGPLRHDLPAAHRPRACTRPGPARRCGWSPPPATRCRSRGSAPSWWRSWTRSAG